MSDAWRVQFGPATTVNWPGNAMRAVGNESVAGRIKHAIGSIRRATSHGYAPLPQTIATRSLRLLDAISGGYPTHP